MNIKKSIIISLVLFLGLSPLFAQEHLGLRFDKYSGVNSLFINPSLTVNSPFLWDANIVSGEVFVGTNYGFITNTTVPEILNNLDNIALSPTIDESIEQPAPGALIFDFLQTYKKGFAYVDAQITGPAVTINFEKGFAASIYIAMRSALSVQGLSTNLNYYNYREEPLNRFLDIAPSRVAGMIWAEAGGNFAWKKELSNGTIALGATGKLLAGYEGMAISNNTTAGLMKVGGDSLAIRNVDLEVAMTTTNAEGEAMNVSLNGYGVGIDLGFTYSMDNQDGSTFSIGASIMDIGVIAFNNRAIKHTYQSVDTILVVGNDFNTIGSYAGFFRELSQDVYQNNGGSADGEKFTVGLPTALNIQLKYGFTENLFLDVAATQRLPLGKFAIGRSNFLAFSPSYSTRWLGASLPLIWHNYNNLNVGFSVRLAFLTFGSDDLFSWISRSEVDGTDFYIALKANPFNLADFGRKTRGKKARCYKF